MSESKPSETSANPRSKTSADRWRRLEVLFEAVVDLSASERKALLHRECGEDASMRREIEALLAADEVEDDFIEPLAEIVPRDDSADSEDLLREGSRLGPYEVERLLASGGMGKVYLARRVDQQYEKRVAVKVIKRGMDTDEVLRRFRHERQTLANLDHPHIARLFDGGVGPNGLPYLVMEFIEGVPIDEFCDRHSFSVRRRIQIFRQVCEAVDYAHRNLVVHRDLKPANILVNEDGAPKLLDFGISKVLQSSGEGEHSLLTQEGPRPLTPDYGSPEQVRGDAVTIASDVYSIGIVLYELLTGFRPYRVTTSSSSEMEAIVCRKQPDPPSVAVVRGAGLRTGSENGDGSSSAPRAPRPFAPGEARRLRRQLAGDLDRIVMMALRKEPERRYPSVRELSEDLGRYLEGKPVIARQDSWSYRAGKFLGRHVALTVMAGVLLVTLIGGAVTVVWQGHLARVEAVKSRQIADFVRGMLASVRPELEGIEVTVQEVLEEASLRIREDFADQPEIRASLLLTIGQSFESLGRYDRAEPLLRQALELQTDLSGEEGLNSAILLNHLGHVMISRGFYAEAGDFLERARRLTASARRGALVLERANSLEHLSSLRLENGRLEESEKMIKEALEIRTAEFGADDLRTVQTRARWASVLLERGRFLEAKQTFEAALARVEEILGEDDPRVANELVDFGLLLYRLRGAEPAYPLLERAVAIRREKLGAEHPSLAQSLTAFGMALVGLGKKDEAEACFGEAISINEKRLGSDHPALANALNDLGLIKTSKREFEESVELHHRALRILEGKFGRDHLQVAITLEHLGRLYQVWHFSYGEKAKDYYRQALEIRRRVLGDSHPNLESALLPLGALTFGYGEYDEAISYYEEAIELQRQTLPANHPRIAHSLFQLSMAHDQLGDQETRLRLLRECREIYLQSEPGGSDYVSSVELSLAECLVFLKRFEEAEERFEVGMARMTEQLGEHSMNFQVHVRGMIRAYESVGRPAEVERYKKLLEKAMAAREG